MTMLERMARAMQRSPAWPAVFAAGTAEVLCRAALEAIRDPTPQMVAAVAPQSDVVCPRSFEIAKVALDHLPANTSPDVPDALAGMAQDWTAMIDHILSEVPC